MAYTAIAIERIVAHVPRLRCLRYWRQSDWAQALFLFLGFGLILAGFTLALIATTRVFVPADTAFMETTSTTLVSANAKLLPLVAHDRATVGTTLIANGVAVLCISTWGFRQGARWLWWTFAVSGTSAFGLTIGAHMVIGYTDGPHLAPVTAGAFLYCIALYSAYDYLSCAGPDEKKR